MLNIRLALKGAEVLEATVGFIAKLREKSREASEKIFGEMLLLVVLALCLMITYIGT